MDQDLAIVAKLLVHAGAQAQKAADYVLNRTCLS